MRGPRPPKLFSFNNPLMSSSLTFNFLSLDPPRRESLYSTMFVVVAGCCIFFLLLLLFFHVL